VQRSLTAAALLSALLVGGGLGVVALRVQQVHLAYQLDALRAERGRAEDDRSRAGAGGACPRVRGGIGGRGRRAA
jgi:hypothetical protein